MTLRWKPEQDGTGYSAFSGKVMVGLVSLQHQGEGWIYDACCAVPIRGAGKVYGEVKSAATARRAVERAWQRWLERAALVPRPRSPLPPETKPERPDADA